MWLGEPPKAAWRWVEGAALALDAVSPLAQFIDHGTVAWHIGLEEIVSTYPAAGAQHPEHALGLRDPVCAFERPHGFFCAS